MKKLITILLLISLTTITAFGLTGTYTDNLYFYLPGYGEYGTDAFNEYETYMQIADTQIESNKTEARTNKWNATSAPGVTNDTDEGYIAGSTWVDVTNDKAYVCLDNTDGAAVWTEVTQAGGGSGTVTTSGTPVANDIARFTGATVIEGRSYAELKADLDLEIGTDVEAHDDGLLSIAGLTTAANKSIYTTALDTYAVYDLTAFARTILDDADASAVRITLGLVYGTNVQAYDDGLLSLAGLTYASDSFIKVTATDVYAIRTIAEVKTDLSLNNVSNVATDDTAYNATSWDANSDAATKNALRDKIEAMGGYTNLTEFVEQIAWRLFYSNTDGDVVELALGADGTYLESNGAAAAPTFTVPAGAGDVSKVGTPVDSQVGVWTGDGTIEGAASLTYDGSNLQLTGDIGSTGSRITKGWFADLQVTNAIAGSVTGNARGLVSVSNGDVTIQPNGTGNTIIYAPADVVTSKTGTATLTIAEAGTVLVSCAATPYTITLPTAVGHSGLRYHFIKTDANYFLITLDGNAAETLNYENSTGAPVATYARLNTYCAEVTIVSDGTNWQVIDEAMGQIPICRAYLAVQQTNLTSGDWEPVDLDTEIFDIGSNFDVGNWVSGTATSTSAGHLVDSGGAFTSNMLHKRIKNTTDTTYTYITAVNSATDLSVRDNIFVDTEGYEIKASKFVCPVAGTYDIRYSAGFSSVVADKRYWVGDYINETGDSNLLFHSSHAQNLYAAGSSLKNLSVNDEITLRVVCDAAVDTVDVAGDSRQTWIAIRLISKD